MADELHFYDRVKETIQKVIDAKGDDTITWAEGLGLVGIVVEMAIHTFRAAGDTDEAHFNTLVTDAERVYDELIAPLDLPIPNLLERFVDPMLRNMIRPMLEQLRDVLET